MPSPFHQGLVAVAVLASSSLATAYNVFPIGPGQASKWGSNAVGTPGGVVTWSLMADGTALDPSTAGLGMSGTSNLSSVFAQVGGMPAAMTAIQAAFNAWSAVANIQFVQVNESGMKPFGAAYGGAQVVGNIRIGAFAIDGYVGAVGYAPPPNGGTTLEGDIVFNVNNRFGIPAGSEGDLYELYPASNDYYYLNDFAGLMTHELGHALGLAHTNVPSAVMCGYVDASFDGSTCAFADPDGDGKAPITRLPKADDVAGIRYLYGPAPVPEPRGWVLALAGLAVVTTLVRRRRAPG